MLAQRVGGRLDGGYGREPEVSGAARAAAHRRRVRRSWPYVTSFHNLTRCVRSRRSRRGVRRDERIERGRIAELMERERERFAERTSRVPQSCTSAAEDSLLSRRADELDDPLAGRLPGLPRRRAAGRRGHRRRRQRLRRPLPRRHRGDDRPLAARRRSRRSASGLARGITAMLPTEDAVAVGEEMQRRFGLRDWQFTLSATDANRFVIRIARQITGRPKILVHNHCYHGSVDETVATLVDGEVRPREGNVGAAGRPGRDHPGRRDQRPRGARARARPRRRRLRPGRAGADQHRHRARRRRLPRAPARAHPRDRDAAGDRRDPHALLRARRLHRAPHGLEPDFLTIGKPIGGGVPIGAYGFTDEVAERILEHTVWEAADVGGVGGTLAGNALSLAAARATLAEVLTDEAFEHMIALGERFEAAVAETIAEHGLPWSVTRLGCRAEYMFAPDAAADRRRGGGGDGRGARRAAAPLHAQPRRSC